MKARGEALVVKIGLGVVLDRDGHPKEMTRAQAERYGKRTMPRDLARAGFDAVVSRSDAEMHGGTWFRVSYGKKVPR